jgi:peptide/nickel transport system substrate-binding protein
VKRNIIRNAMVAALTVLALMGGAESRAGEVNWTAAAPGRVDPLTAIDFVGSELMFNLYDTLVMAAPGGKLVPHLADSWEGSGTTYTFHLHKGVKFHSGNPLTADDVVFSYQRIVDVGQGYSFLFKGVVKDVVAVDPLTVRFDLNAPFAPFLASLIRLQVVDKATILAHLKGGPFGKNGDYGQAYLTTTDVGSGAYKVISHDPVALTVLGRFDDYFLGTHPGEPDTARLRYSLEPSAIRTLMEQGGLQLSNAFLPPEILRALGQNKDIDLVHEAPLGIFVAALNTKRPPLDDVHCRRALALAVDYNAILSQLKVNDKISTGRPLRGPLIPGLIGYDANAPVMARDMGKAKVELGQCKYKPGDQPIELSWVAEAPIEERFALLMQQNFQELGFKVEIIKLPWTLFTQRVNTPESTPHLSQLFINAVTTDPDAMYYGMYHSGVAPSYISASWLSDPEVDKVLDQGRTTAGAAERQKIYASLNKLLLDRQPAIFAYETFQVFAKRKELAVPGLDDPARAYPLLGQQQQWRLATLK